MRVALPATGAHASVDGSLRALGGPRVLRFCVQTQKSMSGNVGSEISKSTLVDNVRLGIEVSLIGYRYRTWKFFWGGCGVSL
jgi:hypothetical protein